MTANLQPLRRVPPAVEAGWLSRAYGLGSVFGKALRDSRTAIIVVTALVGVMLTRKRAVSCLHFLAPRCTLDAEHFPPLTTDRKSVV